MEMDIRDRRFGTGVLIELLFILNDTYTTKTGMTILYFHQNDVAIIDYYSFLCLQILFDSALPTYSSRLQVEKTRYIYTRYALPYELKQARM